VAVPFTNHLVVRGLPCSVPVPVPSLVPVPCWLLAVPFRFRLSDIAAFLLYPGLGVKRFQNIAIFLAYRQDTSDDWKYRLMSSILFIGGYFCVFGVFAAGSPKYSKKCLLSSTILRLSGTDKGSEPQPGGQKEDRNCPDFLVFVFWIQIVMKCRVDPYSE
jgi:hypothetical protein